MDADLELTLIAAPEQVQAARRRGLPVACLAYRVGGGGHLFRSRQPAVPPGGLLALDDLGADGRADPAVFCREVLDECLARRASGVYCAFRDRTPPPLRQGAARLAEALARRGLPLYVPEALGDAGPQVRPLISSALSGGSLEQRLREAADRFGPDRTVLLAERTAVDFRLPSPTGQGAALSREALEALLREQAPAVFFSPELCARYFTYRTGPEGVHFVLFDDAGSLRQKLRTAARLGLRRAFLDYAETADLLDEVIPPAGP